MNEHQADREARIFVNGLRKAQVPDDHPMAGQWIPASGEWGPQFRGHPLVRQAEAEGWGRDLRQHCIRVVRRQMFVKQDHSDIDKIMPDDKSIEHWRKQAARVRAADEWRAEVLKQYPSVDDYIVAHRPKHVGAGPVSVADTTASILNKIAPDRKTQAAGGE